MPRRLNKYIYDREHGPYAKRVTHTTLVKCSLAGKGDDFHPINYRPGGPVIDWHCAGDAATHEAVARLTRQHTCYTAVRAGMGTLPHACNPLLTKTKYELMFATEENGMFALLTSAATQLLKSQLRDLSPPLQSRPTIRPGSRRLQDNVYFPAVSVKLWHRSDAARQGLTVTARYDHVRPTQVDFDHARIGSTYTPLMHARDSFFPVAGRLDAFRDVLQTIMQVYAKRLTRIHEHFHGTPTRPKRIIPLRIGP